MTEPTFLIYGANGFTGKLIAERATERGLRPILAGRSNDAIEPLARTLGLLHRVFDLRDPTAVDTGLRGVPLVLHCAGPYSATSRPMVDACLRTGVHYLDITGECAVLEAILARNAEARTAGVVLMPAVGFDVVPTDCLAKKLAEALPDATRLELAFKAHMDASPGTAKTTVEGLHVGALVRENGALTTLKRPRTRDVPFVSGSTFAMSVPWGDLVTGYHSTGIPNITVYMAAPRSVARLAPSLRYLAPVLRSKTVISFLQRSVAGRAAGPTAEQRKTTRTAIWGRVENARGDSVEGHLEVPETYELTVLAALASVERVVRGDISAGATTPSRAFGADFVTILPGAGTFRLER